MGAIGGIFSYTSSPLDPMLPVCMSRSMTIRGGAVREAYIGKQAALLQNMSSKESRSALPRPLTRTANGSAYTIVADGAPCTSELAAEEELFDVAEQTLEAYIALGTDIAETLSGSFTLAILGERRSEVLLLCGTESGKSLFFVNDRDYFAFASEIKALLRFFPDGIRIGRERLWSYLTAPCGSASGAELYAHLSSLMPCTGIVCSAMGISRFSYIPTSISNPKKPPQTPITPPLFVPEPQELKRHLTDILFAFDYPQFDPWMIGTIQASKQSTGDPTRRERALKKLDRSLRELLGDTDTSLLSYLFGAERLSALERERNLAKRIRLRGMLYQTLLWAEHYPIHFV